MENMELLKAMQEMMEIQIGSLVSEMKTNQAKVNANMRIHIPERMQMQIGSLA
jgi:hypothetical protein